MHSSNFFLAERLHSRRLNVIGGENASYYCLNDGLTFHCLQHIILYSIPAHAKFEPQRRRVRKELFLQIWIIMVS